MRPQCDPQLPLMLIDIRLLHLWFPTIRQPMCQLFLPIIHPTQHTPIHTGQLGAIMVITIGGMIIMIALQKHF